MQIPPGYSLQTVPTPPPPKRVRFEAIGEGWKWLQADFGGWVGSFLMAIIGIFGCFAPFLVANVVIALSPGLQPSLAGSHIIGANDWTRIILLTAISLPCGAALQVITACLQWRAVLQIRAQLSQDFFANFKLQGMGGQVFLFGLGVQLALWPLNIAMQIGLLYFGLDAMAAVLYIGYILITISMQVILAFVAPIIVDKQLSARDAFKLATETFQPVYFPLFGVYFVTSLLTGVGLILCCVGVLITAPLFYTVMGVV